MLKDILDIKIDAKQILDNLVGKNAIQKFKDVVFIPDKRVIDFLLKGEKFFLVGTKGAGKTALLIYTALKADELTSAERSFIIFKELRQEEREDYRKLAHITTYDQNEILPYYDYELVWNWLFHVEIYNAITSSDKIIFERDENLANYLEAIETIVQKNVEGNKRLPIVAQDGFIEISVDLPNFPITMSGRVNFIFETKRKGKIRFSTYIERLNELYSNLQEGQSKLYIIVDELNLSTKNEEEFERDICMIRDIIVSIEKFNIMTKATHDWVRIIGGIRTEVVNSVRMRGKEINKSIESYGIVVDWTRYSMEGIKHPLIRLLVNYLRVSESERKVVGSEDQDIFNRWVRKTIDGVASEQYIKEFTLYRPRDIARLLKLFREYCPEEEKISMHAFSQIKKQYSTDCWNEAMEELSIRYTSDELECIEMWLMGFSSIFTYGELKNRAIDQVKNNLNCSSLIDRFDVVLQDLYQVGILGNIVSLPEGKNVTYQRWNFRGDDKLLSTMNIQIHKIFRMRLATH